MGIGGGDSSTRRQYANKLFLPSLAQVDHIDAIGPGLPDIWFHVHLCVLGSKMALRCQEHLDILGGSIEDGGEIRRSHIEWMCCFLCTKC